MCNSPTFYGFDILQAIADGKFHAMEPYDYEAFAGAPEDSLICYDFNKWTVIISPEEAAIKVYAYYFPDPDVAWFDGEASFTLDANGWTPL